VINVADRYLERMGSTVSVYETNQDGLPELPDVLGLGIHLAIVLEQFEAEFAAIKPYF